MSKKKLIIKNKVYQPNYYLINNIYLNFYF
jgi:hypothetical protein